MDDERLKQIIICALEQNPVDLDSLRQVSQFGYVNRQLRRQVWPAFFGISPQQKFIKLLPDADFTEHKYNLQVEKDGKYHVSSQCDHPNLLLLNPFLTCLATLIITIITIC